MFLLRASGRCARLLSIRHPALTLGKQVSALALRSKACSPFRLLRTPTLNVRRAAYSIPSRSAYRYPENLNVFNAGELPVVVSGTVRVVLWVVLGVGTFYLGPLLVLDDAAPWYIAPVVAVGAAIPLILTGIAWGGYVHHINILLPATARKTKEDLMRFAGNVPPSAVVQIKSMWFKPWPVTKEIYFEDFRRLPKSNTRISNLEHSPPKNRDLGAKNPMLNWLVKRSMATYFVNNNQPKDRSRAPGIWKKMWEQIPMAGDQVAIRRPLERRPVLPSNRSATGPGRMKTLSTRRTAHPLGKDSVPKPPTP